MLQKRKCTGARCPKAYKIGWIATGAILGLLLVGGLVWWVWHRMRQEARWAKRSAAQEYGQEVIDGWDKVRPELRALTPGRDVRPGARERGL
jgi:hypothetical protein